MGLQATLASRLEHGPLAPDLALKYAAQVAGMIRELHRDRRVHGGLHVSSIRLAVSGLALAAPPEGVRGLRPVDDIVALGGLLFEMLAPRKAGASGEQAVAGSSGLQAAILQLAQRCMAATTEAGPDIQKVSLEIRLLLLLARQPRPEPLQVPPPAAAPMPEPRADPQPAPLPAVALETPVLRMPLAEDLPPTGSRCPRCQGYHVYHSHARGVIEELLEKIGCPPSRCHRCFYRFVDIFGMRASLPSPAQHRT